MKRLLVMMILIASIAIANAEVIQVPDTIYDKGFVAVPSNFYINLTINKSVQHIPIDVVLVMDCSASMNRTGNIVHGPKIVNITRSNGCCMGGGMGYRNWNYLDNFTLNENASYLEVILQVLEEDYYNDTIPMGMNNVVYDRVDVALDDYNKMGPRWHGMSRWTYTSPVAMDPAVYIFKDVPAGEHSIWVKLRGPPKTEKRVLAVGIPPTKFELSKEAAKNFVKLLKTGDEVGLVRFGANDTTYVVENLTSDFNSVINAVDNLTLDGWRTGPPMCCHRYFAYELTSITAGLELAYNELKKNGRFNSKKVIILISDGENNEGGFNYPSPLDVANLCAKDGIVIYTIGYGLVNNSTLQDIAKITGGKYYYAANEDDLEKIYSELYEEITIYATNVTLTLNFNNPNVKFDQATPAPTSVVGNTVSWQWNELKNNTSITVWINSTIAGEQTVASGSLSYYDYYGWHSRNFTVIMNFTGNLIVNATINKNTTIWEGETVNIMITANYPIANVTYSAVPSITPYNSNFSLNISGSKAVFSWTPFYNYVNNDTTVTLTFNVTSVYGLTNSTSVGITVRNKQVPPVVVIVKTNRTSIREGETVNITLTANYPIGEVIYKATPPITANNSKVNVSISGNNATITWTPLPNYTTTDTITNINITAVCPPYGSGNNTTVIYIKNLPLIVTATVNRTTIREGETLRIDVTTNLPIENVTLTGIPAITPANSIVSITKINDTNAVIEWTPLNNYVNSNTTANLTIGVTDIYGDSNSTSEQVNVINAVPVPTPTPIPTPTLKVYVSEKEVSINESEVYNIYVRVVHVGLPKPNVSYTLIPYGNLTVNHIINNSIILFYEDKTLSNNTTDVYIFSFQPQFTFAPFNNETNPKFGVKFEATTNGYTAENMTNITVNDNTTINNIMTYPIIKSVTLYKEPPYYVGDLILFANITFINGLGWIVIENYDTHSSVRINVAPTQIVNTNNYTATFSFVPTTSGRYLIKAATNDTSVFIPPCNATHPIEVYIKPVTPS